MLTFFALLVWGWCLIDATKRVIGVLESDTPAMQLALITADIGLMVAAMHAVMA